MDESRRPADWPHSVMFFGNGLAAVCDGMGRQMPRYQAGWHGTTVKALEADGFPLAEIPEVLGTPHRVPPHWWSPSTETSYREFFETTSPPGTTRQGD